MGSIDPETISHWMRFREYPYSQILMKHVIEIRTLTLKPQTRDEFHRLFTERSFPLLKRWNFDVVTHGPSMHDENTYYVIRRFETLAQRERLEDDFYGSDDWRLGPREAMLALIEVYMDAVFELEDVTLQGFKREMSEQMDHFLEIRSYNLKPDTRAEFHRLFLEEAMPLLQRWNVDVVAYGPSLHDENSYYLIRRFDSLAHREQSENAFYGSDEWRKGPRESIIALIENYTEFVLALDDVAVQELRKA